MNLREAEVGALIIIPALAFLLPLFRTQLLRTLLSSITLLALVAVSVVFALGGPFEITVSGSMAQTITWAACAGDLLLLAYFYFLGHVRRNLLIRALAVAQVVALIYVEVIKRPPQPADLKFVAGWLAIAMVLIVTIVGSLVVLFAVPYMAEHEKHLEGPTRQPRFFMLLIPFLGAMNGLLLADNLTLMYLFWEITTLCCVLLIRHDETDIAITNSYRALWMNLVGGAAFAGALVYMVAQDVEPNISSLLTAGSGAGGGMLLASALLCIAGFTKAAQMPFQGWLLGAMVAPTPVSALLHSSTMVNAGVYIVLRLAPGYQNTFLSTMVTIVGGFTFAAAAMLAISQIDGKRVLAYSTVSNLGLIVVCAGLNTATALAVGIMLTLFHAVSKGLLFATTGVIESKIESRAIEEMRGLIARMPFTATVGVLAILSMFLPPFGLLVAKWAALEASANHPIAMLAVVLGSTFTLVFWTKWVGRVIGTRPTTRKVKLESLEFLYRFSLGTLALIVLGLSLSVTVVMDRVIAPAVQNWYHGETGYRAVGAALQSDVGTFPVILVMAVLALAVLIPAIFMHSRPANPNSVYLCGEQSSGDEALAFLSASDEPSQIITGFYYFDSWFGEAVHGRWLSGVATVLLVLVVGAGLMR